MKLFPSLVLVVIVLADCNNTMQAQQTGYFISSGKKVDIAHFNKEITTMINDMGVPAVSLAIIDSNKIVFSGNYGYKKLNRVGKVDENTVFEACSLSKMFLLYVVEQLVDEGLIDLDKPLYQYTPNERLEHDQRYKKITARMVLSHSSGIENWQEDHNKDTLEIMSEPGTRFVYSGEGYQYLAKVVETILHEPYETYITKRILHPFKLKNTYLKFYKDSTRPASPESPLNYTLGHRAFGNEVNKWKNTIPVPASGINTNAKDYAQMILALFNKEYVSENRIKEMVKPVVNLAEDNSSLYMGAGFLMMYLGKDTVICFNGINDGFRSELFYSVVNKKGFVYFTNSSNGDLMIGKLNRMTAGLGIDSILSTSFYEQYPSVAIDILRAYREKNATEMFREIDKLKKRGLITTNILNDVGGTFLGYDNAIAQKLFEDNIKMYPQCALSYCLLGQVYQQQKNYSRAYASFVKAKKLKFNMWNIEGSIKDCEQKMTEADRAQLSIQQ